MNRMTQTKAQAQRPAARHKLAQLRKLVARVEPDVSNGPHIATGFADIDAYLARHATLLPCGGLHEIVAARPGDMAAALGFAHHLASRFLFRTATSDMLLYGQTHLTGREAGRPYAPALAAHGLSPEQLLCLDGVRLPDLLWAGEEALRCPAIGCSLLASWSDAPDFTASRRLTLAAREAGRPLLVILGAAAAGAASAATTRWQIEALPQQGWHIRLRKLRMPHAVPPPPQGWTASATGQAAPISSGIPSDISEDISEDIRHRAHPSARTAASV